jgi:MFS family permease
VVLATLSLTEIVSWGVLYYAFGVFLPIMRLDQGWSTVELTTAFSIALGVAGIAGIVVGRLIDSGSPRLLMTTGSLLAASLVVLWSQVRTVWELDIVWAGIGVAMGLTLYVPAFALVAKWFEHDRSRALTTLTLFGALASFIFSPLSAWLIHVLSWRHALLALAAILAALTIPAHAILLRPPPRERSAASPAAHTDVRRVLWSPGFWSLCAGFSFTALAGTAVSVHLVSFLIARGHDVAYSASIAGLVGIGQVPGRFVYGAAARVVPTRIAAGAVLGLCAAALLLLTLTVNAAALTIIALLFGMASGMPTLVRATLIGDLYGSARYGTISGAMSACISGAQALAPALASIAYVIVRGYPALFALLALLYVAGAVLVLFSKVATRFRSGTSLPQE